MNQTIDPKLHAALAAMNELNSFARNPEGRAPRKAIYWLKSRYAIRDAIMAGLLARMRAIQVTTKCHRCHNGIYHDWDGNDRGECYTCKGTSRVTLKFIETAIGEYVWHTPITYNSWLGWPTEDLPFEEAQDWTVKKPGKTFLPVEQAMLLNTVETYWPQWRKNSPFENGREEWDPHRYYIFNYTLNIGMAGAPLRCVLCDGEHHSYASTAQSPGLERTFSLCKICSELPEIWHKLKSVPLPQLHPEIELWRKRHELDFGATWNRHWTDPWNDNRILVDASSSPA